MICRQANVMQSVTVEQIGDMGMEVYVKHEPSSSSGGGLGGTAVIEGGRPGHRSINCSFNVSIIERTWHTSCWCWKASLVGCDGRGLRVISCNFSVI